MMSSASAAGGCGYLNTPVCARAADFPKIYAAPSGGIVVPMRQRALAMTAFVFVIAITILASAQAPTPGRSGGIEANDNVACGALKSVTGLPNATTVITAADLRAATAAQPAQSAIAPAMPALPEHCEVRGTINARAGANGQRYAIAFHLRLPSAWNGRFFFEGGGGSN